MDDIFVNLAVMAQKNRDNRVINGENTRKTPAEVETPLPPLNFSQIGNMCPRMQKKDEANVSNGSQKILMPPATTIPLQASRRRVNKATFFPPDRRTLVAPVLPEPQVLISIPLHSFVKMKPVGNEPTMYPINNGHSDNFIQFLLSKKGNDSKI
jgi:hypothetical protein